VNPDTYELLFDRPNTVMVSKTYVVGKFDGIGEVSVKTAWVLGESSKFYAASFGGQLIEDCA